MKSSLRRLRAVATTKPPVPLSVGHPNRALQFNLGAGRASLEAAMRAYGMSGTVYSIVSLLAQSAASPDWHLYRKDRSPTTRRRYAKGDQGSDQRPEVLTHAALTLWNSPNSFHTRFEFQEGSQQHVELTGETFWVLDYAGVNFPTSMWYVRPDRMQPVPSPDDYLVGWVYTGPSGEQVPLRMNEVIQEKLPDPLDPYRGSGPVASIMPNIQQQQYATEYQRNLFLNGADPGGVITFDKKVHDREFQDMIDRWRETHQGVARAGRIGVLEGGATWTASTHTNKDLEYGNLRLANRDELREAWRIHKTMMGTADDVNRANAQTAEEVFVAWQTVPRLERRKDTLNHKLLPLFGTSGEGVEFDYEDPSPVDAETTNQELLVKSQAAAALIGAGYDPSDVLETVGLPEMGVVERATQAPALPPSWVAEPPPAPPREQIAARGRRGLYAQDTAAKVFEQQAEDYPPEAMSWMHHASWSGPVEVPLDHIDPMMRWLDIASPDHVQDFVKKIRKGKELKPVLLVKRPDQEKLLLIDGHHRYLAAAQEKLPVRAYIGTVDAEHGGWDTMHDYQTHGRRPQDQVWQQLGDILGAGTTRPSARSVLWNVAADQQPPSQQQQQFEPDLADVAALTAAILATLTGHYLAQILPAQRQQAAEQAQRAAGQAPQQQAQALAGIDVATDTAAAMILAAMLTLASRQAHLAAAEARAAGVPGITAQVPDAALLQTTAAMIASELGRDVDTAAVRAAAMAIASGDNPAQVAIAVRRAIDGLSSARIQDRLDQALHVAVNEARKATFFAGTLLPGVVYEYIATERMDNNTCEPCGLENGTNLGRSDDPQTQARVLAAYPMGGFVDCLGGARCRGTVFVRPIQQAAGQLPGAPSAIAGSALVAALRDRPYAARALTQANGRRSDV